VFHINGQLGAFLLALPEKAGKPLVGNHKLSYTKYPLKYFVQLKSKHTLRLYELLSQYVYKGSIDFNYGDLCRILKTEGMIGRFKYFNRDILLDARDTINELTNLRCEFSLEKHRKSDIILHFDVKDNIPLADIKSLKDELSWLGVSEVGIDYILEKKCIAFDVISNNIKYVTKVIEENNGIRNVGAFLYTAINNNYAGKFKESGASAVKKFIKSTEMVHNSSGFERLGRLSEEYRDEVKRVIKTCLEGKQAKEVLQTYVLSDSSNFLREYVKRHFDMKTVTIDDLLSSQIIYIKIKHYLNENKIVHIESQGDFMKRKGETVDELYLLENGLA
jgi:ribosomal protein L31E